MRRITQHHLVCSLALDAARTPGTSNALSRSWCLKNTPLSANVSSCHRNPKNRVAPSGTLGTTASRKRVGREVGVGTSVRNMPQCSTLVTFQHARTTQKKNVFCCGKLRSQRSGQPLCVKVWVGRRWALGNKHCPGHAIIVLCCALSDVACAIQEDKADRATGFRILRTCSTHMVDPTGALLTSTDNAQLTFLPFSKETSTPREVLGSRTPQTPS